MSGGSVAGMFDERFRDQVKDLELDAAPARFVTVFGRVYAVPLKLRNLPGEFGFYCGLVAIIWSFVPVLGYLVSLPAGLVAVMTGLTGYVAGDWLVATNHRRALAGTIMGLLGFVLVGFGGGRIW